MRNQTLQKLIALSTQCPFRLCDDRATASFSLYLRIFQLKGGLAAKNLDHNRKLLLLSVNILDSTRETAERSITNLYCLSDHEVVAILVDLSDFVGSAKHPLNFTLAQRLGS